MEPRNSFIFERYYWEIIQQLPDKARLALYDAIVLYALYGIQPELTGKAYMAFPGIQLGLDLSRQRSEWGKKGGSKKKAKPKQTETEIE